MEFKSPKYLADTLDLLDTASDSVVVCAGLTHLLRFYHEFPFGPHDSPESVIHIGDLAGLRECKEEGDRFDLGSTLRISDLVKDQFLGQFGEAIWDAARLTSTPQIRNQRTLGGEVAWGSLHSPLIASLMAFDAQIKIRKAVSKDSRAREENMKLADFYEDSLERKNSHGSKLVCRKAKLETRDLILKFCIPSYSFRQRGTFSFYRQLSPKISTENPGVVLAVRGVAQNGVLTKAQFVAAGRWIWPLKEEIPLEGSKLQPNIFFEKLFQFCERYPMAKVRRMGPSPKQLSSILFGLMKDGFSNYMGVS